MKNYFKDKVVFITGSSKGIGKATALLLGSYGSIVCINGRNIISLEDTYHELEQTNVECLQLPGDVADSAQCREMVEKIISKYGRLDVLVNNAGIASHGKFRDLTINAWDSVVGINLMGPIYMSTHALPYIIESKGSILFISTPAGKVGIPGHSSYSVSKMGLTALAEAMQIELGKTGVHTGIIYVGFTENEENKQILNPDGTYRKLPARKQRKAGREEVARAIASAIYKRKKSLTMGSVGKLQAFALRWSPFAVKMILKKADKDYDTMYNQ
jgi:dehydrogenase/reductase SDR family member 7B